ncbi:hypothetical protein NC652_030212 [Populus alba x Populus x berolinensis]|nr:hypothetical protein NC652_030212 [Populus alba x Populus x berolinensis]
MSLMKLSFLDLAGISHYQVLELVGEFDLDRCSGCSFSKISHYSPNFALLLREVFPVENMELLLAGSHPISIRSELTDNFSVI